MVKTAGKKTRPGSIRALNLPALLDAEEDGRRRPVSITLRRRTLAVASVEEVWEVLDEWWRASPVARRYYQVRLEDGTALTVFRDLLTGLWYRQRDG
jgi:hypothetical protein